MLCIILCPQICRWHHASAPYNCARKFFWTTHHLDLTCVWLLLLKGVIEWQHKLWLQCCQEPLWGLDGCWNTGSIKGCRQIVIDILNHLCHLGLYEWWSISSHTPKYHQVVRCCIEHAAVVAKSFLTSDVVVVEAKESKPVRVRPPMPPRSLIPPIPASGNSWIFIWRRYIFIWMSNLLALFTAMFSVSGIRV